LGLRKGETIMAFNYKALKDEIDNDPLVRGYATMTDVEVADDINAVYRQRNRETMMASEAFNAIVKLEFNALNDVNQQLVWDIIHMGELNPFGLEADIFVDIFGAGSGTITALKDIRKEDISRGEELGLGVVYASYVAEARAM